MLTLWFPNTSTSCTCILKLGSRWRFLASGREKKQSVGGVKGNPVEGRLRRRRHDSCLQLTSLIHETLFLLLLSLFFLFFLKKVILVPLLGWIIAGLLWFEDVTENGPLRRVQPLGRHLDDARSYFWLANKTRPPSTWSHSAPSAFNQEVKNTFLDSPVKSEKHCLSFLPNVPSN